MSTINSWTAAGFPYAFVQLRREYRRRAGPRWWWVNSAIGFGAGAALLYGAKDIAPSVFIPDEDIRAKLSRNMQTVVVGSTLAGLTNWMFKSRNPVWGPAHYHRVLNKVFFLRPLLVGFTVGSSYCYARALAQQRRQEVNEPGHFRPVPGQVAAGIAATVWAVLWAEGMPHLIAGYAAFGLVSGFYDYVQARGIPQWYGQEMNPDDFPMKGVWLAHTRGNLPHNRTYDPTSLYKEPLYLPSLDKPFGNGTINIPIQEARVINPLAGKSPELKNTTLVAASH